MLQYDFYDFVLAPAAMYKYRSEGLHLLRPEVFPHADFITGRNAVFWYPSNASISKPFVTALLHHRLQRLQVVRSCAEHQLSDFFHSSCSSLNKGVSFYITVEYEPPRPALKPSTVCALGTT